jgi:hypothetical protein
LPLPWLSQRGCERVAGQSVSWKSSQNIPYLLGVHQGYMSFLEGRKSHDYVLNAHKKCWFVLGIRIFDSQPIKPHQGIVFLENQI